MYGILIKEEEFAVKQMRRIAFNELSDFYNEVSLGFLFDKQAMAVAIHEIYLSYDKGK